MRNKKILLVLTSALLAVSAVFPSMAGTKSSKSKNEISSISISFAVDKESDEEVQKAEPTTNGSNYEIEEISVSPDYDSWAAGKKTTFSLTVVPKEGYHFKNGTTKVTVSGKNAEVVKSTISNNKATIKINYWPTQDLTGPTGLYMEDDYIMKWEKVPGCSKYEVQIFRDGASYKKVETTKPEIDLSSYMTDDEYEYSVSVRAIAKDEKQKKYMKDSEWVSFDDPMDSFSENTVSGEFTGSDDNIKFKLEDGYAQGWQCINTRWFYFDPENDNRAAVGWKQIGGIWYHFDTDAVMQKGWYTEDSNKYYLNESEMNGRPLGAAVTGWIQMGPQSPWYYLNDGSNPNFPYAAMLKNCTTPDGYQLDENGELPEASAPENISGPSVSASSTHTKSASDPEVVSGTWKQGASGWYFVLSDNSNYLSNGWFWIDGNHDGTAECYYFSPEGWLLISTTTPDGYTVNSDGAWVS